MGMRLGCGTGLYEWQRVGTCAAPQKVDCALSGVDLLTHRGDLVDNTAHLLLHSGRLSPCDRDIEALLSWKGYALLLSSDTDCLSLWDAEGPMRTLRIGVYPQDMALYGQAAVVCGGADGRVHIVSLPELHALASYPVPGMPERICVTGGAAYLLTLLPESEVATALLRLDLRTGVYQELERFAGLPGAICSASNGLWVAVSEQLLHRPHNGTEADTLIQGFGLIRRLDAQGSYVLAADPLEGLCALAAASPRPTVSVLHRGDIGMAIFTGYDQSPVYTANTQPMCSKADRPSVRPAK